MNLLYKLNRYCMTAAAGLLGFAMLGGCENGLEEEITARELRSHVEYLASDVLEGRYTGTPGVAAADFIRARILTGFRNEEFFVGKVDYDRGIYQLRRDDTLITVLQAGGDITLSTAPEHEQYVRLMLLEEILDMRDLVQGLKSLESPDELGRDLLQGLFGEPDEGDGDEPDDSDEPDDGDEPPTST